MKKIIRLTGILFCISSFSAGQTGNKEYFEGFVEYEVVYQSFIPGVSDNEIKERLGAKHRYYVKGNNYMREGRDENDYVLYRNIYIGADKRTYDISLLQPDTVYYNNVTDSAFLSVTISDGGTETILNCICPSSVADITYYSAYAADTAHMKLSYFFCDQFPVNPEWYSGYTYWYDLVKKYKSVALKFIEESEELYKTIFTAIKINRVELSDEAFQFDRTMPMKKVSL